MPFNLPPELLIGPASGLVIALVFALTMKQMFEKQMAQNKETTEELISVFKLEVHACEERYKQVLQQLFEIQKEIKNG